VIAILDYDICSAEVLIEVLNKLKVDYIITSGEYDISKASGVILPDSNDFKYSLRYLHLKNLFSYLRLLKKPVLGIGAGMKLLCEFSEEDEICGLGTFPVKIEKSGSSLDKYTIPGYNEILINKDSMLFNGCGTKEKFFFPRLNNIISSRAATSTLNGTGTITSVEKENFFGVQFLPEMSNEAGEKIIENFINYK